jgi:hypothetical protein
MKKILPFIFACLLCIQLHSQVAVDNTNNTDQVVEDIFLANGIFVSNITFNGAAANSINEQFASFTDVNNEIGITGGLVMSTGHVLDAQYMASGMSITNSYMPQDPDVLAMLTNEFTLGDNATLEFDFIATGDSLDFIYVFASDEYPEWVESAFNDHFGFLISGPGINGTFSNGAVNIALIPGTTETVGINSLNEFEHSQYYVDNQLSIAQMGYDAFTTPLHASIGSLVVGEVYHVKLVIADVSDSALDSAVFLQGNSFVQICNEPGDNLMDGQCMLSNLHANVEYTETCGTISLTNLSEMNIETTGCYYELGDGNTTTACDANTMYSYAESGTYTLKLAYQVNAFKAKFTIGDILISDTPPALPAISQNGNMLEITNWDGVSSLQWYVNGAQILDATGTTVLIEESGSYTVTANNGCPVTSSAFVANGISEMVDPNGMVVYPNPSNGTTTVKMPMGTQYLEVYNTQGQLVQTMNVNGLNNIDITANTGMYSVRAFNSTGEVLASRAWLVKE